MPASTFLPMFSVCVCTRDNPDGLRQTLQSIFESTMPPHEILVSDDSSNYDTRQMMRESYATIPYLEGPRRSQAANRNRLVRAATGSHVLFLDDRTLLGPTFLQQMAERIADDYIHWAQAEDGGTPLILTGLVLRDGLCCRPCKVSFLGYPLPEHRNGERICSVVLHGAVFPRDLFATEWFNEQLAPDYDVNELVDRAVHMWRHRIELVPSAVNRNLAIAASPEEPVLNDASRFYAMFRGYKSLQHRPFTALAFALLAWTEILWRCVRTDGVQGAATAWRTIGQLRRLLRECSNEYPGLSDRARFPGTAA
ncbi:MULTISPECIES: glycosyltransferase family 2 protein [Cupriavidus]|uniref:Glycosyl transferase, family 2 n=1 Tax=Cupriavidus pinatubonensis (strain JMP 134 / LMG 1197) TaxID=264198 RepID=Q46Q60_CUPPJ|nr:MULTISPECIES: glycosyltransferase family 2 protein [Cupriavidus]QYY27661.1 glycosyltransferase family 2 protein [Cupriavidus pinatubonensis]TPQ38970.1 glycosyltransferase family 2 protein [Cupriavidus pinatubonensis]